MKRLLESNQGPSIGDDSSDHHDEPFPKNGSKFFASHKRIPTSSSIFVVGENVKIARAVIFKLIIIFEQRSKIVSQFRASGWLISREKSWPAIGSHIEVQNSISLDDFHYSHPLFYALILFF